MFIDDLMFISRNDVEKQIALENLDLILLCIDEIVDRGYGLSDIFIN